MHSSAGGNSNTSKKVPGEVSGRNIHQKASRTKGKNKGQTQNSSKQISSPKTSSGNTTADERPEPPELGEEDFPSLPVVEDDHLLPCNTSSCSSIGSHCNRIEVEKVPDQRSDVDEDELFVKARTGSDSSSTVTTSTSSTPSPAPSVTSTVLGGYAAALLKAAPVPVSTSTKTRISSSTSNAKENKAVNKDTLKSSSSQKSKAAC